jgi:hypothetical protein
MNGWVNMDQMVAMTNREVGFSDGSSIQLSKASPDFNEYIAKLKAQEAATWLES